MIDIEENFVNSLHLDKCIGMVFCEFSIIFIGSTNPCLNFRLNKFYNKKGIYFPMESKKTKVSKPSGFVKNSSTITSKENESKKKQLKIAERFILKSCIGTGIFYKTYRAIDMMSRKFVTVYIKPFSKQKVFSKTIKEELKQKICPPVIWSDTYKIDKNSFDIEVHTKYGPSLQQILQLYKKKISEGTFFLLTYHLIKLADRLDNAGFICRNLSLRTIIFSDNYHKNQVYLLNSFDIQKKNQENLLSYDPRYCSIGSHLKLKGSSKDTVESMCYILMDFYLGGKLFPSHQNMTENDYLEQKSIYRPEGIPSLFANFFCYVKSLNHNEDIKFTQWKRNFKKQIENIDDHPYEWIKLKNSNLTDSKKRQPGVKEGFLAAFGVGNLKNQQNLSSNQSLVSSDQPKNSQCLDSEQQDLQSFDLPIGQIEQSQINENLTQKIEAFQMDKLLQSNNFFKSRHLN